MIDAAKFISLDARDSPPIVKLTWFKSLRGAGWKADGPAPRSFTAPWRRLWLVPRNARDRSLHNRLKGLFNQEFAAFWADHASRSARFVLDCEGSAWRIPWEAMAGVFRSVHGVPSIVRALDVRCAPSPSRVEGRLRVLMLHGAAREPGSAAPPLDLSAEAQGIFSAYESLPSAVREKIDQPQVVTADHETLAKAVEHAKPHVVIFSGHGRTRLSWRGHVTEVLLADGVWCRAEEYARLITSGVSTPLFAVFWACQTAARAGLRGLDGPALAQELLGVGVCEVVGMQAAISDAAAVLLARQLFVQIAHGLPLEAGIAEARELVWRHSATTFDRGDWAVPVVWSGSGPMPTILWDSPELQLSLRQLACVRVAEASLGPPHLRPRAGVGGDGAPRWQGARRLWINGDPSCPSSISTLMDALVQLQAGEPDPVLPVDLRGAAGHQASRCADDALTEWAESVGPYLVPGQLPQPHGSLLRLIGRQPREGWERLCHQEGMTLALVLQGDLLDAEFFWKALANHPGQLLVLSQDEPPPASGDWEHDVLDGTPVHSASIEEARRRAPGLLEMLAVLSEPLPIERARVPDASTPDSTLANLSDLELTSVLPSGHVLRAPVRRAVLDALKPEELREAHRRAAVILDEPGLLLRTDDRERRLSHLLAADEIPIGLEEAAAVISSLVNTNKPRQLLGVLRLLDSHDAELKYDLPSRSLLDIAWAYVSIGVTDLGEFWLDRVTPDTPTLKARQLVLWSEVLKDSVSTGAREEILGCIDAAIASCSAGGGSEACRAPFVRNLRHDRARVLHYLFYDLAGASSEYQQLIREWVDDPGDRDALAATLRNYSECLLALGKSQLARESIGQARSMAEAERLDFLLSEIEYVAAKVAQAQGNDVEHRERIEECRKKSLQSGNDMVLAIADARRLWHFEPFALERWRDIAQRLSSFPRHGWAVRSLVDGSLRAAHCLQVAGQAGDGADEVTRAIEAMQSRPTFASGSDKLRLATAYCGREQMGGPPAWESFLCEVGWAAEWLEEQGRPHSGQVWRDNFACSTGGS